MASEKDRFDKLPRARGRVGAHRGTRTRGFGWLWFVVAVLVAVLLTAAALAVIPVVTGQQLYLPWASKSSAAPTDSATSAPPEILDPSQIDPSRQISIIVLNGTPLNGLQDQVFSQLQAGGWPVTSKGNAATRDQQSTVVYYSTPADVDVARGLADTLGAGSVQSVDASQYPGASITIVVGEDSPLYPEPSDGATSGAAGP